MHNSFALALIIVLIVGTAGIAYIGKDAELRADTVTMQLCGMSTGLPEYEYVKGELYCRTKEGSLTRPITATFYQTRTDSGFGYAPIPLRKCLK